MKFLSNQQEVRKELEDTLSKIGQLQATPPPQVSADIRISMLECDTLEAICQKHTFMATPSDSAHECNADISCLLTSEIHKKMTIPLHIRNSQREPDISCTLNLTRSNTKVDGVSVTRVSREEHLIQIPPLERGRHQLMVKVDGKHIPSSPFKFRVKLPHTSLSSPVTELHCSKPFGLTYVRGTGTVLMVEEGRRRITKVKDRRFAGHINVPSEYLAEVTTDTRGNIYITTGETHRLLKLDSKGNLLKSVGSYGSGPLEFNFANGIDINSSDELYVCDTENHRVKVLDTNLNLLRIIRDLFCREDPLRSREDPLHSREDPLRSRDGHLKSIPLKSPYDVGFDKHDNVYILESHRIQVITKQGDYLRTIGERKLGDAVCIKVAGASIFVTDYLNGCVCIFTTDGEYVWKFGMGCLTRPQGMTVDSDGFVYITTARGTLYVY